MPARRRSSTRCVAPGVFALIRRIVGVRAVAEDVFQDTMIMVFEQLDQYRQEAPLGAWAGKIALSRSLMFLRSPWHRARLSFGSHADAEALLDPAHLSLPGPEPKPSMWSGRWRASPRRRARWSGCTKWRAGRTRRSPAVLAGRSAFQNPNWPARISGCGPGSNPRHPRHAPRPRPRSCWSDCAICRTATAPYDYSEFSHRYSRRRVQPDPASAAAAGRRAGGAGGRMGAQAWPGCR